MVVALAAVLARVALAGLPLIVTNDGVGYLAWGREIASGDAAAIPANRTPGYPVFLAVVFVVGGIGSAAVLVGQHVLGVVTSGVVAWSVNRRHGRRWAIAMGLAAGLWPALFVWESYALSETTAVCVMVSGCAMALAPGRWRWGVGVGLLLGAACLVRPAAQVVVPFAAVGWWMSGERKLGRGAGVLVGVVVVVAPWAVYNAGRGVTGLASGGGVATWMGFAQAGALDEPAPESVRAEYERLKGGAVNDARVHEFLVDAGVWGSAAKQGELSAWAWRSARTRPGAYLRGAARSTAALLELRRRMETDTGWSLWRLSRDGRELGQSAANFQLSGDGEAVREFAMGRSGFAAGIVGRAAGLGLRGMPQVILFAAAAAAIVVLLRKRRWGEALVVTGMIAYFGAHVVMLQPWSRMAVPAWACWLLVFPDGARGLTRWLGRRWACLPAGHIV